MAADALMQWANEHLGRQQRLTTLEFRADLPRNPTGKPLKYALRAPDWAIPTSPRPGPVQRSAPQRRSETRAASVAAS